MNRTGTGDKGNKEKFRLSRWFSDEPFTYRLALLALTICSVVSSCLAAVDPCSLGLSLYRITIIALGVAGMGLAIFLCARLLFRLHLRSFLVAMQEAKLGKFTPVDSPSAGEEFYRMADNFNQMLRGLAQAQRESKEQTSSLEHRLRIRNLELESAKLAAETALRQAMEASETKNEFLANMSHELRTPMNGVLGMLRLTLETDVTADQREHLETAFRCAQSQLALVNDLLDLSKIEAGKLVLEQAPFDIRVLVEDCMKTYMMQASEKNIFLSYQLVPELPSRLIGDSLRVYQIISNLLGNALKFTDAGAVTLRVDGRPDPTGNVRLTIEVADTGEGIPLDKQSLIFEKFTQADSSVGRRHGGSGLGLAITRKLVELMGGRIEVRSQIGIGSSFFVHLTLEIDRQPSRPLPPMPGRDTAKNAMPLPPQIRETATQPRPKTVCRGRILVVEDNLVNQKVVNAILRNASYETITANNGKEAISLLQEHQFDLILMDVQMPVMNGLQATETIRANHLYRELPIIAMTAHAMVGDQDRCLQAGMNAYVSKPLNPTLLKKLIEDFIAKRNLSTLRLRQSTLHVQ